MDNTIEKQIKNAQDYQLEMCATRMEITIRECADNLSSNIAKDIMDQCDEELAKRKDNK